MPGSVWHQFPDIQCPCSTAPGPLRALPGTTLGSFGLCVRGWQWSHSSAGVSRQRVAIPNHRKGGNVSAASSTHQQPSTTSRRETVRQRIPRVRPREKKHFMWMMGCAFCGWAGLLLSAERSKVLFVNIVLPLSRGPCNMNASFKQGRCSTALHTEGLQSLTQPLWGHATGSISA